MSAAKRPKLLTLAISHFSEKARWALDRAGWDYDESPHIPLLHYGASLLANRQKSLPILITTQGVIGDSTDILRFVDRSLAAERRLFPEGDSETEQLEDDFDRKLGPATRRFGYSHLILDHAQFVRAISDGGPPGERALTRTFGRPIRALMTRGLGLGPKGAEKARSRILETLDALDKRLADGRRYLTGDRFTAADLTFAALVAPAVLPPEYGGHLPSEAEVPPAFTELLNEARSRPSGKHALRLYRDERRR